MVYDEIYDKVKINYLLVIGKKSNLLKQLIKK